MGLFSNGEQTIVVFDIGSGSVGAAVVSIEKMEKPTVLYTTRHPIAFQDTFTFDRFLTSMLKAFEKVVADIRKQEVRKVQKVYCTLSAPWYVSQTKTVSKTYKKDTSITKKEVDELITKEVVSIKKSFDSHYSEISKSEAKVIEVESVNIRLNGYDTNKPFGKKAQSFDAHLYVSMSSNDILEKLRALIHKNLRVKDIAFRSFALVAFSTLRDMYSNNTDFIFLDISGEMTDVSIIRKSTLTETITFPHGKNYVLRTLASRLNTVPQDALSSLSLVLDGKASAEVRDRVHGALEHVKEEWLAEFRKHMQKLSTNTVLPGVVFLITDPPYDVLFDDTVTHANFPNLPLMRDNLDVQPVSEKVVSKFVLYKPVATRDSFLVIEALFAAKDLQPNKY